MTDHIPGRTRPAASPPVTDEIKSRNFLKQLFKD